MVIAGVTAGETVIMDVTKFLVICSEISLKLSRHILHLIMSQYQAMILTQWQQVKVPLHQFGCSVSFPVKLEQKFPNQCNRNLTVIDSKRLFVSGVRGVAEVRYFSFCGSDGPVSRQKF